MSSEDGIFRRFVEGAFPRAPTTSHGWLEALVPGSFCYNGTVSGSRPPRGRVDGTSRPLFSPIESAESPEVAFHGQPV